MKKKYLLLFNLLPIIAFSQLEVNTVEVTSNDLVYDNITDRIYVSIPSSNGSNGNSIGVINPNNYTLENTVFIGSEPTVIAISDDGQFIYSGFSGSSTVRRFEIPTLTSGLQFSLGSDSSTGSFYVEDIEVMPGQSNSIAVSRRNIGFSPKHEGVAIYDDGVMRPNTTPDHTGSNRIEFISQNSLIGYNNETTEFGIRRMSVNNSGINVLGVTQNVLSGFGEDFSYYNNRMYATDGTVVDTTNSLFVIGTFSNANGPSVYDTSTDLVCYASFDFSGNIVFQRFNPNTFLVEDNLPISVAFGDVNNIITCGSGCYAFNSSDNKVVIIKDTSLSLTEFDYENELSIYPNPTLDYLSIKNGQNIEKVLIYDISGKLVSQFNNKYENLYLGDLASGSYFVKIIDSNSITTNRKLLKK
ncbi:MAG: T9SS type A sorting domain-containing protein [Algicola sp.]|nr:T9SS type A sorting domain-containing protein [Algicola sp.]